MQAVARYHRGGMPARGASGARVGVVIRDEYSMSSLSGLTDSATALSSSNLFFGGASESAGSDREKGQERR